MHNNKVGGSMEPALLGAVIGPALQLQQPVLWPWPAYAALLAGALVFWALTGSARRRSGLWAAPLLATALVAFGACGLRATHFQGKGLEAALEGRDVVVTGVITAMPQATELGQRFRLEVESFELVGGGPPVPPQVQLSWWNGAVPAPVLRAGERWKMTVRLKAPHGNLNPFGFDYELWLWEQGLHATGNVRAATLVESTWHHPVEQARQFVREAIYARVFERKAAGLLAALVTGDQNAIELGSCDYVVLPQNTCSQRRALLQSA